jgi:hypothetical protein
MPFTPQQDLHQALVHQVIIRDKDLQPGDFLIFRVVFISEVHQKPSGQEFGDEFVKANRLPAIHLASIC